MVASVWRTRRRRRRRNLKESSENAVRGRFES
jgi:hypothetical protein